MVTDLPAINLKAIGVVRNSIKEPSWHDFNDVLSEIMVDSSLTEALDNLDEFSHIIVIYYMHRQSGPAPKKVHPMGSPERPFMGVFATRSPSRPNPLGKGIARLLQRQGNKLIVKGLDAIDGTPVLDIKPYIPGYDSVRNAKAPSWAVKQ